MRKFIIIASGLNCKDYVRKCYDSIAAQSYTNFETILISDGSTDGTHRVFIELSRIEDKRFHCWQFAENLGAAYRRNEAILRHSSSPDDIIVFMGLDDELKSNALIRISQEYDEGKLMTYGNWINQHDTVCTADLDFDEQTHADRSYRKVKWRSTAPQSFKRFLFDRIPQEDFKLNGEASLFLAALRCAAKIGSALSRMLFICTMKGESAAALEDLAVNTNMIFMTRFV